MESYYILIAIEIGYFRTEDSHCILIAVETDDLRNEASLFQNVEEIPNITLKRCSEETDISYFNNFNNHNSPASFWSSSSGKDFRYVSHISSLETLVRNRLTVIAEPQLRS